MSASYYLSRKANVCVFNVPVPVDRMSLGFACAAPDFPTYEPFVYTLAWNCPGYLQAALAHLHWRWP